MILYILIALAVMVGGLAIYIATRADDFRITRSATISAPVYLVFPQVNDFHHWEAWSPWAKMDPNVKNTFSGPASGQGAQFRWEGNNQVGAGAMTIVESSTNQLIQIKLEFLKPFRATHRVDFTFEPLGDDTLVTWSMSGKNSFMAKAVTLVMNCDKMIGSQYEKGLSNLGFVVQSELTAKS